VHNRRSGFLIFFFSDPRLLKGSKSSKYRTTNPNRELSFNRSNDFNFDSFIGQGIKFLIESFLQRLKHSSTTWKSDALVEFSSKINIWFLNAIVYQLMDSFNIKSQHLRLEQTLWGSYQHTSHFDFLSIWQFKVFLLIRVSIELL
jgi:hypothetical protein